MKVSCLIPFRDADGTRTPGMRWILARWKHYWPEWEYIVASDDGVDPFNKSLAVNKAAALATGDMFVVLDADTWVDPTWMTKAFAIIKAGRYKWTRPTQSFRLTKQWSEHLLKMPPDAPLPPLVSNRLMVEQSGGVVGFLWVVPREGFEAVHGMDERFRGWGGEDSCFAHALHVLYGPVARCPGAVMSLWHARPRDSSMGGRTWEGQTAEHYAARQALGQQYTKAQTPARMRELLGIAS